MNLRNAIYIKNDFIWLNDHLSKISEDFAVLEASEEGLSNYT